MFLGLCRVHFSFSTCLLSFSHYVTNHPSISITWPITLLVTWLPIWPVTCHSVTCSSKVTCPMSPVPKSPVHHLILPHLTPHDFFYPWLVNYSLTLASLLVSQPDYHFFSHKPPFYNSYWLPPCYLHVWVSSAVYDSIFWAMTHY